MLQSTRRLELLNKETQGVDTTQVMAALSALEAEAAEVATAESNKQQQLDELRQDFEQRQDRLRARDASMQQSQRDLHTREGRLESLLTLQNAALAGEANLQWLKSQGLDSAPRLAKALKVSKGWETAVETVLGQWLQSVTARTDADRIRAFSGARDSRLDLVDDTTGNVKAQPGTLAEFVRGPDAVIAWLNKVRVTPSLELAWESRTELHNGSSFITQAGEWLGDGWLRIARGKAGEDGMLSREKAIEELQEGITVLGAEVAKQVSGSQQEHADLAVLQRQIQDLQFEVTAQHRRHSELSGQLHSRRSSLQLMRDRQGSIAREVLELEQQGEQDSQAVRLVRARLDTLLGDLAGIKLERDQLDSRRGELLARREASRAALQRSA